MDFGTWNVKPFVESYLGYTMYPLLKHKAYEMVPHAYEDRAC